MLCDKCKQKQATVHVVENVNGEKTEMHLCEDCAKAMNLKMNLSLPSATDLLGSFFEPFGGFGIKDRVCPKCGTRFSDFSRTGYLGCSSCYEQFQDQLQPVIRRMHGKVKHVGKVPKGYNQALAAEREYERLNAELKQAIETERYEDAAEIRDKIKKLSESKRG